MKDRFTRVLKGNIALDTALFPRGTNGGQLDGFARRPLWEAGLDFAQDRKSTRLNPATNAPLVCPLLLAKKINTERAQVQSQLPKPNIVIRLIKQKTTKQTE